MRRPPSAPHAEGRHARRLLHVNTGMIMRTINQKSGLAAIISLGAALSTAGAAGAQAHSHAAAFPIPESMQAEHAELHVALEHAAQASGRVGDAARQLAAVLHPHFVREEQIALPPLGLLGPLAQGEWRPEMRDVLHMTDSLRAELPQMLREHEAVAAAAQNLESIAHMDGDAEAEELARALQRHASSEEELFYPAAVLVGELVRARMSAVGTTPR